MLRGGIKMKSEIINFFSTKAVSEKIIKNKLSEGQLFLYFYLVMVFDALNFSLSGISFSGEKLTTSSLVFIWGYFLVTVLGLIVLFIANGGRKGRNFIAKFFTFSVTIGIKYEIAMEIISRLPEYISFLKLPHYCLILWWIVNLLMIGNMTYRIYKIRSR